MSTDIERQKELKALFKEQVSEAIVTMLPEYLMDLRTDGDVEDKRKFLALGLEAVGWKEAAPKEQNNLPRANIVINLAVDATKPAQVITIDAEELLKPSAAMLEDASINELLDLND